MNIKPATTIQRLMSMWNLIKHRLKLKIQYQQSNFYPLISNRNTVFLNLKSKTKSSVTAIKLWWRTLLTIPQNWLQRKRNKILLRRHNRTRQLATSTKFNSVFHFLTCTQFTIKSQSTLIKNFVQFSLKLVQNSKENLRKLRGYYYKFGLMKAP